MDKNIIKPNKAERNRKKKANYERDKDEADDRAERDNRYGKNNW